VRPAKKQPSRQESAISWTIMGVLALITLGVFVEQFDYDPGLFVSAVEQSPVSSELTSHSPPGSDFEAFLSTEMDVLSPIEFFDAETLSEKINGKAELYLGAGFVGLRTQRFARAVEPGTWMEVFVYHMGKLRQAFAVFSVQRRDGATPLNLTRFVYRTANAFYFVHGPYYVEIISSVASEEMTAAMLFFTELFLEKTPVEEGKTIDEMALFPAQHLEAGSTRLLISDAFGFGGLTDVFTAQYNLAGERVTGFLSQRATPAEAEKMAQDYEAFLLSLDGTKVPLKSPFPNAVLIDVFGRVELIFHDGVYVAGVHDGETKKGAEKVGWMIKEKLEELGPR